MKDKKIKIQDYWLPVKPPIQIMRRLVNQNIYPQIEMQMVEDGVDATVTFPFFFQGAAHVGFIDANYKRIIKGPSRGVYQRAARAASKIGLSDERNFNTEWNRTLLNLLNEPSPNKTMINLGVVPSTYESGLYNIKNPSEMSGSITQVHENSPILATRRERLITFNDKKSKIKPDAD